MNDNAKKWVAALRSGEFKQTKKRLKDGVGYCCLGVACEVYQRETGENIETYYGGDEPMYFFGRERDVPPTSVCKWLGLLNPVGAFSEDGCFTSLSRRNDGGATFSEIADLIESEPDGLFVHSASVRPDEMNPSEVSS